MRMVSIIFAISYGVLLVSWMGRTPAYNGNLRLPDANGNEIPADTSAMYDYGQYLFEIGYTYISRDLDMLLTPEGSDASLIEFERVQLRAQRGLQYLDHSAAITPGDAHTWMTIAWAHAIQDVSIERVLKPLRLSWRCAPFNRILATRRLVLIATLLSEESDTKAAITAQDRVGIARDIATLSLFEPATLLRIREIAPRAALLLETPQWPAAGFMDTEIRCL